MPSTFTFDASLRWTRFAVFVLLAFAGLLVASTQADAQTRTCGGLAVTVDIAAGQSPTAGPDVILGTAGSDRIAAGAGDDVICGLGGNDRIFGGPGNDTVIGGGGRDRLVGGPGFDTVRGGRGADRLAVADGAADVAAGGRGADTCIADTGLDTLRGCGTRPGGAGPFSIALMVADAGFLTPQENSLTGMLRANGHTVTPFTVTARPRVNAANNPSIDLLLFSPSFEYSQIYHPAQRNSLPMLDMTKNSWYRRYVLPWGDQIAGPRFSSITDTSQRVYYEDDGIIPWTGRRVGPVRVLRTTRFSGGAPMRAAIDHSTRGAAQHFLRHVSDTGAESSIGVYVPAGSTITRPAPTRREERRRTSKAPWIGLILFNDDFGDGNQYAQLTPAGVALFDAAMQRLMNP